MAKKSRTIPLGPFELVARIGVGGGGEVWRGHHVDQGVAVAVKVMSTERASDERYHAAFEHEVRAVAGLDHPGIVTVYDFGEENGVLYMVLELITGHTLADALQGRARLPLPRAVRGARP